MSEQAVRFLTNLLGIYSPSGKEQDIANFLVVQMEKMGFEVGIDTIGNVIGVIGEGEHVICFVVTGHIAGHMPFVSKKEKFNARAQGTQKDLSCNGYGSGFCFNDPDLKAIILVAIRRRGTQARAFVTITQGITADYAIFGEPSGVENITIGYKGQIQLKIQVKTETGHASSPWLYDNALEKAYELWEKIKSACSFPSIDPQETPFTSITACLVKMVGGTGDSVIPFEAEMILDVRVPIQFTTVQVHDKMMKIIGNYQAANPEVFIKSTVQDTVEPFEANKASPMVHALSSSVRKVLGKPATLLRKTGTGDMNILGKAMSLPIVTYGPGDGHLDHTIDEHIEIQEYLQAIDIYKDFLLKLSQVHNNKKANVASDDSQ
jgi:LysW-gamma-L-lysine carboxypeptidase